MEFKPAPLTPEEFVILHKISEELRWAARGIVSGRQTIANELSRRMGKNTTKPSTRALVALADLQRPKPETLRGIAQALNRPEMGEGWVELWASVNHPRMEESA